MVEFRRALLVTPTTEVKNTKNVLSGLGYVTEQAYTPNLAVEAVQEANRAGQPYDLIVLMHRQLQADSSPGEYFQLDAEERKIQAELTDHRNKDRKDEIQRQLEGVQARGVEMIDSNGFARFLEGCKERNLFNGNHTKVLGVCNKTQLLQMIKLMQEAGLTDDRFVIDDRGLMPGFTLLKEAPDVYCFLEGEREPQPAVGRG